MSKNVFYEKRGPFPLKEIVKTIGYIGNFSNENNLEIYGFESLNNAGKNDMTFLNSSKYKDLSNFHLGNQYQLLDKTFLTP